MAIIEKLANDLVVIVEEIDHLESVAYNLFLRGGVVNDPEERVGASLVLAELIGRGAGELDSRALSDAFDARGISHQEASSLNRYVLRCSLLSDYLSDALELTAKMVKQPRLPQEELASIKSLLIQDIEALKDNPSRRALVELAKLYFPVPFNRPVIGELEGINATSLKDIVALKEQCFLPGGAVLSVAGKVKASRVIKEAGKVFTGWSGEGPGIPDFKGFPKPQAYHIDSNSAQLQIALIYPSAKFGDHDYYAAKVLNGILSGGMFGRLFIEVREKKGLCYSIYSRHGSTAEYGTVTVYAGTTPERAQETLDTIIEVLTGIKGTISDEELERAKANIVSALVIGEESTGARAASNASDWWTSGRVRTLDEIKEKIFNVTIEDINRHLEAYSPLNCSILTLGSRRLELPVDNKGE
ncbi:MAG: insulinase family protein [Candidatus Dadabacteria bacterium]|nr:MAG: insulinase family protein [Candidatus Dadabacteria bacterium]